jgi:signal transduction histidine kinase
MQFRWNSLPIVYKLFLPLIGVIAFIMITLLSYLWGHESKLMLNKEQENIHAHSTSVADDLKIHMVGLQKELLFLSHLELMNDMVTRDMDRRITSILEQKAKDLGESIVLFTIAPDLTVSASSKLTHVNTIPKEASAIFKAAAQKKSYLFFGKNLYFFTPIYGTFYTQDILGYLVIAYPLENFNKQLKSDQHFYRWLTPPAIESSILYANDHPALHTDDYLIDSIALDGVLSGWVLNYAMPKDEALILLHDFQTLFLVAFGIGLLLIGFLIWILVNRIINPLRTLSDTAMAIATTGDYTRTVPEIGNDEVGTMASSFNALMYTTRIMMKRLEIEREKHWDKLISLIVFFNAITRADTKESTIEIAMYEIRRFSNAKKVYFTDDVSQTNGLSIALNAVGNETTGIICIEEPELEKETNERFYAALERMLALQMERIELLKKTQNALNSKSAFLSAMSHELRTPLGSILSLTQYMMTQSKTPEPMRETLGKIENSAYHLLGVINNILDFAKAESGKMEAHAVTCDPVEVIQEALDLVSPLADDKELSITTSFQPSSIPFVSDPRLFGQVVINLLSNAIKYTMYGSISVRLHYEEGTFILEIKDTGRGIASEALEHIFDEFYQVHSKDKDRSEGSGLGLAISKRIAILLRGDLMISSEGEGRGTLASFHFRSF